MISVVSDQPLRFSVVVPAYNEEDSLAATLASLLGQDFTGPYEVIVVDNGSEDGTAAIARRCGVRVIVEERRGVCAARQAGTAAARGEIVVSTDADTTHPPDWLTRLDADFRADARVVAVAGACRYAQPPWWAAVFPPLWFAGIGLIYRVTGRVSYLTATNVAFTRANFPGYDATLTQGGDEVDLLRRLRRRGRVHWDAHNPVTTSSRRMNQGLPHTLVVSYGYHYALNYVLNRVLNRSILGPAPAIRSEQSRAVRRRRRQWRAALVTTVVLLTVRRLWLSAGRGRGRA